VGTLALAVRGRALMRLPQPRAGFLVQDDLFHASKFTPLFRDYYLDARLFQAGNSSAELPSYSLLNRWIDAVLLPTARPYGMAPVA
jgi:hypothetical protein